MVDTTVFHLRSFGGKLTLPMYSVLMKAYAYSGQFERACDLYTDLLKDGLEPDSLMYGCLIKFASECGRTQLLAELFKRTPGGPDIQNYMSLIRAAGRERNPHKALEILEEIRGLIVVDTAAYNCVLDVKCWDGNAGRSRIFPNPVSSTSLYKYS